MGEVLRGGALFTFLRRFGEGPTLKFRGWDGKLPFVGLRD